MSRTRTRYMFESQDETKLSKRCIEKRYKLETCRHKLGSRKEKSTLFSRLRSESARQEFVRQRVRSLYTPLWYASICRLCSVVVI